MSRTKYAAKNIFSGVVSQTIRTLMCFICRSVFIYTLSSEYLGVNGLFSNMLTILNLAELGLGDAIIYSLYKPIAENDESKISSLMNFYRGAYRIIGVTVMFLGLSLMPFLDRFITVNHSISDLKLIYILYLMDSVCTYFFAYKMTILIGSQKTYFINYVEAGITLSLNVAQIVLLVLTHNFIVYLLIQIVFSYANNVIVSAIADKEYPYLRHNKQLKLTKVEKKEIFRYIKATMFHKLGGVILYSTDNLIISKFINIIMVGVYSNYVMLVNSVSAFLIQCFKSLTAGVGNLLVIESNEKAFQVFKQMLLINFWLYSFSCICLINLMNPFINLWIGKSYLLDIPTMVLIVVNFYIVGMRQTVGIFKRTKGLFYKDRYKPVFECFLNIVLSVFLVKKIGVFGVLLGTFISFMLTSFWIDPFLVYRHIFNRRLRYYFIRYALYTVLAVAVELFLWLVLDSVSYKNVYADFTVRLLLSLIVPNAVYLIVFCKSEEFVSLKNLFKCALNKILNRQCYIIQH